MKLRAIKKPKNKDKDLGYNMNPLQNSKKNSQQKSKSNEKDNRSSNEANSNESNENESNRRHQLRKSSTNFQGKYKKMNSGKYLYKLSTSDKRPSIAKKRQLKYIPNDLINQLKKFIVHLYKKEEETFLNKKKKREEGKSVKKTEKPIRRPNKPPVPTQNYQPNINQMMPYHSLELLQGNNLFANKPFNDPPHNTGFQFQNRGMFMINHGGFNAPPTYPFLTIDPKEPFNSGYLEYVINKGVTNHIIGAFYILFAQQAKAKETPELTKRIVKVNTVNINEQQHQETDNKAISKDKNGNPKVNTQPCKPTGAENVIFSPKKPNKQDEAKNSSNTLQNNSINSTKENEERIRNMISEPLIDVNIAGEQQLNTVHSVIKNIKENKINEIIDKQ